MTELIFRSGSTASGCRDVVVDPERAGWTYSGLTIASLAKGETFELITDDHEYLVLPLEGSFTVQGDGFRASLAGRNTVWGEVTDYAFVPRRRTVAVTAVSGGRVALPNALASEDLEPRYCPAEEVRVELRGAGNCSRQVVNYAVSNPLHTSRCWPVRSLLQAATGRRTRRTNTMRSRRPSTSSRRSITSRSAVTSTAPAWPFTGPTGLRIGRSMWPRWSPTETWHWCRTAGTAPARPLPGMTSITSTLWRGRAPPSGNRSTIRITGGFVRLGRTKTLTPVCCWQWMAQRSDYD